jgi:hypothetical protein
MKKDLGARRNGGYCWAVEDSRRVGRSFMLASRGHSRLSWSESVCVAEKRFLDIFEKDRLSSVCTYPQRLCPPRRLLQATSHGNSSGTKTRPRARLTCAQKTQPTKNSHIFEPSQPDTTTIARPWHCDDARSLGVNNDPTIIRSLIHPRYIKLSHHAGAFY